MSKQHTPTDYYVLVKITGDFSIKEKETNTSVALVSDEETASRIVKACNNHDRLVEALHDARIMLSQIRRSMMAHPDHEEGSEFDDMTTGAQIIENRIEKLLTELKA